MGSLKLIGDYTLVPFSDIILGMTDNKPMTPPVEFQMGIVKISGDAVKVEEKPKEEEKK